MALPQVLSPGKFLPHTPALAYSYREISEFLHQNIGLPGTIAAVRPLETELERLSQKINADGVTGILQQCVPHNTLRRKYWTDSEIT